jgi:hypothetical protein
VKAYSKIYISNTKIYVRFENIGNYLVFGQFFDYFNRKFVNKQWRADRRAWEMPIFDLASFLEFSQANFGVGNFVVQSDIGESD